MAVFTGKQAKQPDIVHMADGAAADLLRSLAQDRSIDDAIFQGERFFNHHGKGQVPYDCARFPLMARALSCAYVARFKATPRNNLGASKKHADDAAAKLPKSSELWVCKARVALALNKVLVAEDYARNALSCNPDNIRAQAVFAECIGQQGQSRRAFQKLLPYATREYDMYAMKVLARLAAATGEEAISNYARLLHYYCIQGLIPSFSKQQLRVAHNVRVADRAEMDAAKSRLGDHRTSPLLAFSAHSELQRYRCA